MSALLLQLLLQSLPLLLLLPHPARIKESGTGIPAGDQRLFSPKLSNVAPTITRVRVSSHRAVRDIVVIREITRGVTGATNTTVEDVAGVNVKDATRWAMRPKIVEARDQ